MRVRHRVTGRGLTENWDREMCVCTCYTSKTIGTCECILSYPVKSQGASVRRCGEESKWRIVSEMCRLNGNSMA